MPLSKDTYMAIQAQSRSDAQSAIRADGFASAQNRNSATRRDLVRHA
jgi:hypothetical protein